MGEFLSRNRNPSPLGRLIEIAPFVFKMCHFGMKNALRVWFAALPTFRGGASIVLEPTVKSISVARTNADRRACSPSPRESALGAAFGKRPEGSDYREIKSCRIPSSQLCGEVLSPDLPTCCLHCLSYRFCFWDYLSVFVLLRRTSHCVSIIDHYGSCCSVITGERLCFPPLQTLLHTLHCSGIKKLQEN